MKINNTLFIVLSALLMSSCLTTPKPVEEADRSAQSNLTQGNVQLVVQVGKTNKAQVLENFGAPNITTRDVSGREVWTYQRSAQVAQSSSKTSYWTLLLAGKESNNSGFESSSRMMTLIIKFDSNDVVSDFSSRTSNF